MKIIEKLKQTPSRYIAARRKSQPLAELQRKADKARRRQNVWTQEEVDLVAATAVNMMLELRVE